MMKALKLVGMRQAYDEVIADAVKRQHAAPRVVGDLLNADIAETQGPSIKYQQPVATLPLAKELAAFDLTGPPHHVDHLPALSAPRFLHPPPPHLIVGPTRHRK